MVILSQLTEEHLTNPESVLTDEQKDTLKRQFDADRGLHFCGYYICQRKNQEINDVYEFVKFSCRGTPKIAKWCSECRTLMRDTRRQDRQSFTALRAAAAGPPQAQAPFSMQQGARRDRQSRRNAAAQPTTAQRYYALPRLPQIRPSRAPPTVPAAPTSASAAGSAGYAPAPFQSASASASASAYSLPSSATRAPARSLPVGQLPLPAAVLPSNTPAPAPSRGVSPSDVQWEEWCNF